MFAQRSPDIPDKNEAMLILPKLVDLFRCIPSVKKLSLSNFLLPYRFWLQMKSCINSFSKARSKKGHKQYKK
jgi:hypothetical protein